MMTSLNISLPGLDGHGFEQAPGVGEGQEGLACCSPWGRKEARQLFNIVKIKSVFGYQLSEDPVKSTPL